MTKSRNIPYHKGLEGVFFYVCFLYFYAILLYFLYPLPIFSFFLNLAPHYSLFLFFHSFSLFFVLFVKFSLFCKPHPQLQISIIRSRLFSRVIFTRIGQTQIIESHAYFMTCMHEEYMIIRGLIQKRQYQSAID